MIKVLPIIWNTYAQFSFPELNFKLAFDYKIIEFEISIFFTYKIFKIWMFKEFKLTVRDSYNFESTETKKFSRKMKAVEDSAYILT